MTDRMAVPVETWRGIDPRWAECGGLSYTNLLVRAPCEKVIEALLKDRETPKHVADLLAEAPPAPLRDGLVFAYQLLGHDWSQIDESGDAALGPDTAENLSRQLGTQVFVHSWDDAACGHCYQLFEHGELVEAFITLYDNPIYQGDQGKEDLRRKRAEGWRISDDHTFEFFTQRGTALDIESSEECHSLLERTVTGLGMFVVHSPFWWNERQGRIETPWAGILKLLAEAKVLYSTAEARATRQVGDDAKLLLGESLEKWRALQELLDHYRFPETPPSPDES